MSPYRASARLTCRHSWQTEVVHFNFGDPVVRARCAKCAAMGSDLRNSWHTFAWVLHTFAWVFPRWLLGTAFPALVLVSVLVSVFASAMYAILWALSWVSA